MCAPMFFEKIDEFLTTLIQKDVVRQVLVMMRQYLLLVYDTAHSLSRLWWVVATTPTGLQAQYRCLLHIVAIGNDSVSDKTAIDI